MTAEQVIMLADRKARAAGFRWTIGSWGIRCNGRCPLEVAADCPEDEFIQAYAALKLPWEVYEPIIGAADGPEAHMCLFEEKTKLRALMLATFDFGPEGAQA